jgi:hypothetical protein
MVLARGIQSRNFSTLCHSVVINVRRHLKLSATTAQLCGLRSDRHAVTARAPLRLPMQAGMQTFAGDAAMRVQRISGRQVEGSSDSSMIHLRELLDVSAARVPWMSVSTGVRPSPRPTLAETQCVMYVTILAAAQAGTDSWIELPLTSTNGSKL